MISYFKSAEYYKVDAILNVCSSVGEVADIARTIVSTPIVKIDDAMTDEAVKKATCIGVAATLKTTLDPTCRLLEKKAESIGKKIILTRTLCPGAFEYLMSGDSKKHDEIVLKEVKKLSNSVDIVVLAQGSMARLTDGLDSDLFKRVLSSPRSGVMEIKKVLGI
ncbi:MAG: aspartate/glutamate racemase family protein [Actinomycetota bacterium]|nr:aspartate/glutamate racemase family protein [Actinomycetota bacterium]